MPDLDQFLTTDADNANDPAAAAEPTAVQPELDLSHEAEKPADTADTGATGEPPSPQLPPRGEDGKFVKREAAADREHMVPLSALMAERERRQAAEQAAQSRTNEPPPDWFDDPDKAFEVRLEARKGELLSEAEARAREMFFLFTENAARDRHTDYDQMREIFTEEAQRNPGLAEQLRNAPDPAEFIYKQGRVASELREVGGDLAAYRKRVEANVRAQVEKEVAAKLARTSNIPQSLNTESSKGAGVVGSSWTGPTPLENILPRGNSR
jgi:hypothetical protein